MKKIKRKFLILPSLAVIVVVAACSKKFLDKPPLGTLNPEIMATEKGVQGLLIGAYSLVDGEGCTGRWLCIRCVKLDTWWCYRR